MPLPKSVKFSRNGVEFLSNCDRIQYTLKELTRAALRDTGAKKNQAAHRSPCQKHTILGASKAGNT